MTNAHLTRYKPADNINITRGKKFRGVIAPVFAKTMGRGVESELRRAKRSLSTSSEPGYRNRMPIRFIEL